MADLTFYSSIRQGAALAITRPDGAPASPSIPRVQLPVTLAYQAETDAIGPASTLGTRLAALRARGVLIIGSGNIVHNLGAIDWSRPHAGADWAHRFDDAARAALEGRPHDLVTLDRHPDFKRAAPTPDHFIPALYLAGLAAAADTQAEVLVEGYAFGSLSMTSYVLEADCPDEAGGAEPGAELPDPAVLPPEDTNI